MMCCRTAFDSCVHSGRDSWGPFDRLPAPILCAAILCWWLTAAAAPPSASWQAVWTDEFNSTSLDASKWNWGSLPWGGQHHNDQYASWITPAPQSSDGVFYLTLPLTNSERQFFGWGLGKDAFQHGPLGVRPLG